MTDCIFSVPLLLLACCCAANAAGPGEFAAVTPTTGSVVGTPLTVTLEWSASAQALSYSFVVRVEGGKRPIVSVDNIKDTSFRLPLCPNTRYEWTVTAANAGGKTVATGAPYKFSTPAPVLQEITDYKVIFAGMRPGAVYVGADPLPEDASEPISPWFSKKKFDQSPPPTFEQVKDRLPKPVWDGHSDAIDMYWYSWKTFLSIWIFAPQGKDHIAVSNLLGLPTWCGLGATMVWDTAFILQFARYGDNAYPFITSLDNCYARQHENGFICRESHNDNRETFAIYPVNPPLLAWAEWSYYRVTGDKDRLRKVFLPLVKQYEWYMLYQRRMSGLYWTSGFNEADDSPRNALAQSYVSTTSVQAMSAEILSQMAVVAGRDDLHKWFQGEYGNLKSLVNANFWDAGHRLYNDLGADGKPITVTQQGGVCKHCHIFWPLLAGIAEGNRAKDMAAVLSDESTFLRPTGIASLSADSNGYNKEDGQYWLGAVWPPIQCMVIQGLERCGAEDLALKISDRYYNAFLTAYKANGDIHENLAPDKPEMVGCGEFVGWGGVAPIELLFEDVFGIKADAPTNKIEWRLRQLERHGIENLRFGKRTVSLICEARKSASDSYKISVDSDGDFELVIRVGDKTVSKRIHKGHTVVS